MLDPHDRRDRQARLEVCKAGRPGWRRFVGNHDQRPPRVLRLVPGMEQFFLITLLGLVEQTAPNAFNEAAGEQRSARPSRPGEYRRLDGPHAPVAEVVEGFAVRIGSDEPRMAVAIRPVERERDLVGPLLHCGFGGGWTAG